jgi:hypothetical protein
MRRRIGVMRPVVLAALAALAPASALAGGAPGGLPATRLGMDASTASGWRGQAGSLFRGGFPHHPDRHHQRFGRHAARGAGYPVALYGSSLVYDGVLCDPAACDAPPVVYAAAPLYAPAVADGVVEYPTGRYELRGDGVSTPYVWVWIPNPPSAPPAPAPAASPPAPPAPPSSVPRAAPEPPAPASVASDQASARTSRLYRWVDEQGVVHLTDAWESVPDRYRSQARRGEP